ncbi:MAG: hypothetical protein SOZ80_08130 [Prevotella sp.]|uniref:hypothetical protein n=1 Tax=Prevotella sp. TaxID=59823 RepID=UPI002A315399|nr:hypothetical protein [Prevotella sp.]MDD7317809.1 hypothetical protein [Prevotellaceae bacterium]MDY4020724.1 hypothetical protein [Prevotella sp.]
MYIVRRAVVWLRRCRHCRGFGVQSPWAYRFVRYVINEHYPYYSYAPLRHRWGGEGRQERKMCRLYFRIANFLQPSLAVDYSARHDIFKDHVNSGCRKTEVCLIPPCSPPGDIDVLLSRHAVIPFLRIAAEGGYQTVFAKAVSKADSRSIFVVEGINKNAATKKFWREIVASEQYPTTFDLYYCGIIFFNKKRYKENYIVNF